MKAKIIDLKNKIYERQAHLNNITRNRDLKLSDPDIYRISCEIDRLVVEYMKLVGRG